MQRVHNIISTLLLMLSVWVLSPITVQSETLLLPINKEVTVGTSSITFGDLFQMPREIQQLKNAKVVESYGPGKTQPVYQYQVARALQRANLDGAVRVRGTFPLVVKIGKQLIPESRLTAAIDEYWRQKYSGNASSIQWEYIRSPQLFSYPDEDYTLSISYNGALRSGRIAVSCVVETPCKKATYGVPVKISLNTPVLVAAKNISRGEQLVPQDFTEVTRPLNSREERFAVSDFASLKGSVARMRIEKDAVILSHMIKKNEIIKPGQDVKIKLQMGGIVVSSIGRALEPGAVNDEIEVRDRQTGKILHGTVTHSGIVHVNPIGL